jgi:regulator of protease activity HflC (stomatin/prohibitin superfamily)
LEWLPCLTPFSKLIKPKTMILRVVVPAYQKGLLFRKGKFIKVLSEGTHWLVPGDKVYTYEMTNAFVPPVDLNILLQDDELVAALEVVEVGNSEIALCYEQGLFKGVLGPGRHAFWRGIVERRFVIADVSKVDITEPIESAVLARPELAPFVRTYVVDSFEKGLLYIEGQFKTVLEPGVYRFWKNAIVMTVYKSDVRQLQMELNGQEMLTKDKAALRINFTVQYRVTDIFRAVENKEYDKQLYVLVQLALREQIGIYTLDELLEKRDVVAPAVMESVQEKAAQLGVTVTGCGIRDIILPGDVKEIMNGVLIAEKKAQANIIMRREETASTRSLLNTAKLMEENEMLYKLKEMEYVEKIADKINTLSVSGGGDLVGQLKQIFVPERAGKK